MATETFFAMGLPERSTPDEARAWYKAQCKRLHPDHGGSADVFCAFIAAWPAALLELEETPCPTCEGSGRYAVLRGFSTVSLTCELCEGTGLKYN